jgi:transcriptional regulator with XRE-family HTH domain
MADDEMGVRRLRRDRGLTLEGASYLSDLNIGTWSKVERGLAKPTSETVVKMSRALGISIERMRRILDGGVVDARRH